MIKRIRAARHYQKPDDPVLRLSRSAMRGVARELKHAFTNLASMVDIDKTRTALRHAQSPTNAINWHHFREVLRGVFDRLGKLRHAGGSLGARKINGLFAAKGRKVRFTKATGDQFNFDSFSPAIQQKIRAAQDELIAELESDARDTIERIIADGTMEGTPLDDVAENIRDMIGLTDRQAQAVLNYKQMLENVDPEALSRQLRNEDFDAVFQDAIDQGVDLSDSVINNMVDDYIDNYLDYRAATIAQTESTRAANEGLHDAYEQAIERGALPEEAVTRQWQLGDMPCPICESIPDNNPDGVGVNESFDSDEGAIDDPPVHPNCECSVEYVTDLTMVPEDDSEDYDTNAPVEGLG